MVKIEKKDGIDRYVVVLPEESLHQDFNPDTQMPFASEAEAAAWEAKFKDAKPTPVVVAAKPVLEITLDKAVAAADGAAAITAVFAIRDKKGAVVTAFSGSYKVVIRNADGGIVKTVKIPVSAGQGTINIKSKNALKYQLRSGDFTQTTTAFDLLSFEFVDEITTEVIL